MICVFTCIYTYCETFCDYFMITVTKFMGFFFSVKVQYMGSPFHIQASKVLSHLFTMSLHWTARYSRPPCQFRPHPDITPGVRIVLTP